MNGHAPNVLGSLFHWQCWMWISLKNIMTITVIRLAMSVCVASLPCSINVLAVLEIWLRVMGGEEFAFILPATDGEIALSMAQAIVNSLFDLAILHEASIFGYVTISIGVSSLIPGEEQSSELLVKKSDDALYEAKKHGRNLAVMDSSWS
ncbi:hypothetical protein CCP4SC76_1710013 [Gammaproteobacteria bacterium]